jgi:hypothetical protein
MCRYPHFGQFIVYRFTSGLERWGFSYILCHSFKMRHQLIKQLLQFNSNNADNLDAWFKKIGRKNISKLTTRDSGAAVAMQTINRYSKVKSLRTPVSPKGRGGGCILVGWNTLLKKQIFKGNVAKSNMTTCCLGLYEVHYNTTTWCVWSTSRMKYDKMALHLPALLIQDGAKVRKEHMYM